MLDVFVRVTQSTSVWEALTAIGTLSAVLVALFGPLMWTWWRRPVLKIDYQPCAPFCRSTTMEIEGGTGALAEAYWIRVRITNKGRGTARGCKGKMIAVYTPEGSVREDRDPMPLHWSGMAVMRGLRPLDMARDESQFLDVVYTYDRLPFARILSDPTPPGFARILEAGQRHRVRLAVYADNAEPKTAEFVITYGGDAKSLKMDWA